MVFLAPVSFTGPDRCGTSSALRQITARRTCGATTDMAAKSVSQRRAIHKITRWHLSAPSNRPVGRLTV